jgi:hypothetical protein
MTSTASKPSVADMFLLLARAIGNTDPAYSKPTLSRSDEASFVVDAKEGMTIAEFAAWVGVDRRKLAEQLVDIPPGPVPPSLRRISAENRTR